MGAAPIGYLLALARPQDIEDEWLASFCAGLAADNAEFGISVLGGDTVVDAGAAHPVAHGDRRGAEGRGAAAQRREARRRHLGLGHARRCGARARGPAGHAAGHGARAKPSDRSLPPAPAAAGARPGAARHRARRDRRLGRPAGRSRPHRRDIGGGRGDSHRPSAAVVARSVRRAGRGALGRRRLRAAVHRSSVPARRDRGAGAKSSTCRSPASARCRPPPASGCSTPPAPRSIPSAPAGGIFKADVGSQRSMPT